MTGFLDALLCGFKQLVRNVAGIAPAAGVSIFCDLADKPVCIGELLFEYPVQKFDHEGCRCSIVVVKDDLAVAGFDLPITHWKLPLTETGRSLERNGNNVTTPACRK